MQAYFKYIPLNIGIPILGAVAIVAWLRSLVKRRKSLLFVICKAPFLHSPPHSALLEQDKKLENLDEDFIKELAGDNDQDDKKKADQEAVKSRKAKAKLEQRLAQERKEQNKQTNSGKHKTKGTSGEDDEDEALETFVKGTRGKKTN
jgi:type IV secretory pathway VirB10-like protein